MSQLYGNNASSLLIADLLVADTTITLAPGEGDQFPLPDAGDPESFTMLTLEDVGGNIEITKMTERSGDILTVERAQEDTAPAGFALGSRVEARLTAGSLDNFKQIADQYELRGDEIESDGIRLWHQQDPSTYQFFTLRYYTVDIYGFPVMHIEAPPGINGVTIFLTITGPDGTPKHASLNPDLSGVAPAPATGEVGWFMPGVSGWTTINNAILSPLMYATWDWDVTTATFKLKHEANKTNPISYEWVARDEFEINHPVQIKSDGSFSARSILQLKSSYDATYTEASPWNISYGVSSTSPGDTDIVRFQRSNHNSALRKLAYQFKTIYSLDTDPVTYASKTTTINTLGQIAIETEGTADNHVVTKGYVDTAVATGISGAGLLTLINDIYGRTVLYTNASGSNDGSTQTLAGGASFDDFKQVQIIAKADNQYFPMTIDTATLAAYGSDPTAWAVVQASDSGSNVRQIRIQRLSGTTFKVIDTGVAGTNIGVVEILGMFPTV